ncbi:MAG TPA: thioredoxin domain-containing protein [Chitinophagaceae bacterium]|nr:thioredoxin domain-containing protein [Chitinophagaceae bacterium]
MATDGGTRAADTRPIVVLFRADWCPYCKALEPKMAKLMEQYGERLRFVVFDVTNADTTARAALAAKDEDIIDFFEANKDKASTLAVLKNKSAVFSIMHNSDQDQIAAAFDSVLKEK